MILLQQPPRLAVWLVRLFSQSEKTESVLGDLSEEFSERRSHLGSALARKWYWRQTLTTLPHLLGSAFRASPWITIFAVIGGFVLGKLTGHLPGSAIFAVVERYQVYDHNFALYKFLASTGLDIGMVLQSLLVGCAVAIAARGTEMAATIALAGIHVVRVLVALVFNARLGHDPFSWMLGWYFSDTLAVILGGAIIRMLRQSAATHPAHA